jgi:hypothetical protein
VMFQDIPIDRVTSVKLTTTPTAQEKR